MTFDEWFKNDIIGQDMVTPDLYEFGKQVWEIATNSERERCQTIVQKSLTVHDDPEIILSNRTVIKHLSAACVNLIVAAQERLKEVNQDQATEYKEQIKALMDLAMEKK